MTQTSRTFRRAASVGGAIVALTAAIAVTQATGDTPGSDPQSPTRAQAVLAATQAELADTQHRVDQIRLEHVIDGQEVYALEGPDTACILVAGEDQDAGRSRSLSCTNAALAQPERPMSTGFATARGGYVDLIWVADAAPAQVARSGAAADVRLGSRIVAAHRASDDASARLRWQAPGGDPVAVDLLSRDERSALAPTE